MLREGKISRPAPSYLHRHYSTRQSVQTPTENERNRNKKKKWPKNERTAFLLKTPLRRHTHWCFNEFKFSRFSSQQINLERKNIVILNVFDVNYKAETDFCGSCSQNFNNSGQHRTRGRLPKLNNNIIPALWAAARPQHALRAHKFHFCFGSAWSWCNFAGKSERTGYPPWV